MRFRGPDDWISEAEVIAATRVSSRNLTQWRAQGIVIGRRRHLGRGVGTTPCLYPPDTISLIRRLCELRGMVRDADQWIWQLWLEGFSTDVRRWAVRRLNADLKLARGAGPDGLRQAALRAAEAKPPESLTARVRKPADRLALFSWVAAAVGGYEQQASIHTAEPPIFDILLKAMGIPRSNLVPPKVDFDRLPAQWFHQTLGTANHDESEQLRRDWQAIARLTEALRTVDWDVAGGQFEAKIEALTKSRPEPPSKRRRKENRRRPKPKPPIVDLFLEELLDFKIRPYLLAFCVGIRRSSPDNSHAFTQSIALAESLILHLPQQPAATPESAGQ